MVLMYSNSMCDYLFSEWANKQDNKYWVNIQPIFMYYTTIVRLTGKTPETYTLDYF